MKHVTFWRNVHYILDDLPLKFESLLLQMSKNVQRINTEGSTNRLHQLVKNLWVWIPFPVYTIKSHHLAPVVLELVCNMDGPSLVYTPSLTFPWKRWGQSLPPEMSQNILWGHFTQRKVNIKRQLWHLGMPHAQDIFLKPQIHF